MHNVALSQVTNPSRVQTHASQTVLNKIQASKQSRHTSSITPEVVPIDMAYETLGKQIPKGHTLVVWQLKDGAHLAKLSDPSVPLHEKKNVWKLAAQKNAGSKGFTDQQTVNYLTSSPSFFDIVVGEKPIIKNIRIHPDSPIGYAVLNIGENQAVKINAYAIDTDVDIEFVQFKNSSQATIEERVEDMLQTPLNEITINPDINSDLCAGVAEAAVATAITPELISAVVVEFVPAAVVVGTMVTEAVVAGVMAVAAALGLDPSLPPSSHSLPVVNKGASVNDILQARHNFLDSKFHIS